MSFPLTHIPGGNILSTNPVQASSLAPTLSSGKTNKEIITKNWKEILAVIALLGLHIGTRKKIHNRRVQRAFTFGTVAATSKIMRKKYLTSIINQRQMPSSLVGYGERKENDYLSRYIHWIKNWEETASSSTSIVAALHGPNDLHSRLQLTVRSTVDRCALWTAKVVATVPVACFSACASSKVFGLQ